MFDFTGSPKLYITLFQESFFGGFPDNSVGKKFACNAGDLSSIPGLGRSPGEGKGYPLQHSGLENSLDCIVHEVAESDTPSDFQPTNHYYISSTSDQQVLDPRGWGPLLYSQP